MLTRRSAAATAVVVIGAPVTLPAPAWAEPGGGGVECPQFVTDCSVFAEDGMGDAELPATPPDPEGAPEPDEAPPVPEDRVGIHPVEDDEPWCWDTYGEEPVAVPCYLEQQGWWSEEHSCWLSPTEEQPQGDEAVETWERTGNYRGSPSEHPDGTGYDAYCPNNDSLWRIWLEDPPDGQPDVDIESLAERAVEQMQLEGPEIGLAPDPDGQGVVGMPVWMWAGESETTWGPNTESASAGGVTVEATAEVAEVVWEMGDGTEVTCAGPGTEYDPEQGMAKSPNCGHLYTTASDSEPGGTYTVTATSTWDIAWSGGGQSGALEETRTSDVEVTIGQARGVN